MTEMVVYGKKQQPIKRLQNSKSCDLETWHAAPGFKLFHVYINRDFGITVDHDKVNLRRL